MVRRKLYFEVLSFKLISCEFSRYITNRFSQLILHLQIFFIQFCYVEIFMIGSFEKSKTSLKLQSYGPLWFPERSSFYALLA